MYYDLGADNKFSEETAKIFGVPFQVIPFKANPSGVAPEPVMRMHVHALPARREEFEIRFPRVEGYTQSIRSNLVVDWRLPRLELNPTKIPPEVEMKRYLPNNKGRASLTSPGASENVSMGTYRSERRLQELLFDMAKAITRELVDSRRCEIPVHRLFPQVLAVVNRYVYEFVDPIPPWQRRDVFLSPFFGWVVERLVEAIRPDEAAGEAPEIPRYESRRGPGSTAEVSYWTSRPIREVRKSHVNYLVADTDKWEQTAGYYIDKHPRTHSFVKNAGLGFAIPYLHNGEAHEYLPDFIVRLTDSADSFAIIETKGYDELEDIKRSAAERWVRAVNADGQFGVWRYAVVRNPHHVTDLITQIG
ncbi:MAG: hypothetical protein JNN20_15530 [Betaproteobacteria bacterium]|nr:hypothetical protein [Betaproteobacteria bacterium]